MVTTPPQIRSRGMECPARETLASDPTPCSCSAANPDERKRRAPEPLEVDASCPGARTVRKPSSIKRFGSVVVVDADLRPTEAAIDVVGDVALQIHADRLVAFLLHIID